MRTVGILGGMGPEPAQALLERIKTAAKTGRRSEDVPLVVDLDTKLPSLVDGDGADPLPVLVDMAKRMQDSGAEALAMPCNASHQFAGQLAAAVDIPLLDMVLLTSKTACAAARKGEKVGVLGSPALQETGIFDAAINACGGEAVYPEDSDMLLDAIREIRATGPTPSVRNKVVQASHNLIWQGAHVQLMGCTEFSLLERALDPGAVKVDPLDVLAQAIVRFSRDQAA
ncbi:MAG TPA: aspartate/glutamate racemase family protein [Rhodobacteraceae bacterium]|nr:aspartate/glutamate racemase family protein [Paracoccaceae bacterium]